MTPDYRVGLLKAAEICDKVWEQDHGTIGAGSSAACALAIRALAAEGKDEPEFFCSGTAANIALGSNMTIPGKSAAQSIADQPCQDAASQAKLTSDRIDLPEPPPGIVLQTVDQFLGLPEGTARAVAAPMGTVEYDAMVRQLSRSEQPVSSPVIHREPSEPAVAAPSAVEELRDATETAFPNVLPVAKRHAEELDRLRRRVSEAEGLYHELL